MPLITLVNKSDFCAHGMRYVIFRVVFYTESESGLHFFPENQVFEIFLINFFFEKSQIMRQNIKKFFYEKQHMILIHFSMQNPTVGLFRPSPFEKYMAEKLFVSIELTV